MTLRFTTNFGVLVVMALVLLAAPERAGAQQAVQSYQSSRPALSPYLYLTRPNVGPFPNYQAFVQTTQNQLQINQIQQSQVTTLQQNQQQLQQSQEKLQQLGPAQMAPTGTGSSYNSLSHYYSVSPSASGGRGKQAARK
jgi:hypothetical protein